jgi:hypothetical protein
MPEKKDAWDKFDLLFKSLVLGAIPIAIGIAANHVAESLQRAQLIQSLVESLSKGDARRDIALIALDEAIPPRKKCEIFGIWRCKNDPKNDPVVQISGILVESSIETALEKKENPEALNRDLKVAAKIVRGEKRGNEDYYAKEYATPVSNYINQFHSQTTSSKEGSPLSEKERELQANISQTIADIQPLPEKSPTVDNLVGIRLVYIQYDGNKQLAEQIQKDLQAIPISTPGIERVQEIGENSIRYSNPEDQEEAKALQNYLQEKYSIGFSEPINLSKNGYRVPLGQFEIWLK